MGTAVTGDLIPLLDPNGSAQYVVGRNNSRDIRVGLLGALFLSGADGFTPRPGVLTSSINADGLFVTGQVTPDNTVTVKKGRAVIPRVGQGAYLYVQETDQVVTMPAASSVNPRYDIVCAAAYDKGNFGADAFHGPQIEIISGAVAGSPTVPPTPAGMLKLADVFRAVNDNAISTEVTDRRYTTALTDGIRIASSQDATDPNAGTTWGELRDDGQKIERWNGTTWVTVIYYGTSTGCRYYNNGSDTPTLTTQTRLTYPQTLQSTALVVPSGAFNTDFTVQKTGWWGVSAGGRYGNQNQSCYWSLRKTVSGTVTEIKGENVPSMIFGVATVSDEVYLNAGESVNFSVAPTGSITITPSFELQSFAMKYRGA
jgi:hypothetical protein